MTDKVSIRDLKAKISGKYRDSAIANVLLHEPDELTPLELVAKIMTWQSVIDSEARK